MKRIALFISLVVILCIIITNSTKISANASINITLDTIYATRGQTFKTNLNINNNTGIIGIEADVNLSSGLTIEKVEAGENFKTNLDYNCDISPNKLLWTSSDYQSVTANGTIITLYITIGADTPNGDYPITINQSTLEVYDNKLNPVNVNLTNGVVKVVDERPVVTTTQPATTTTLLATTTAHPATTTTIQATTTTIQLTTTTSVPSQNIILGDINGDNLINVYDIMMLKEYLLQKTVLSTEAMKRADFNSDGEITKEDILLMKGYILSYRKAV